jgi:hypothetical protein
VADAHLAKSAAERGHKRTMSPDDNRPQKRSRSMSSFSSSSVSTTSTSRSRSASRQRRRQHPSPPDRVMTSQYEEEGPLATSSFERKRRRRSSVDSQDNYGRINGDRNTRRRRSALSPGERGRRTSRMEDDVERRPRSATRSHSWQSGRRVSGSVPRAKHGGRGSRSPSPYRRPRDTAPRERSMSPYSKRLALTQAMNSG